MKNVIQISFALFFFFYLIMSLLGWVALFAVKKNERMSWVAVFNLTAMAFFGTMYVLLFC